MARAPGRLAIIIYDPRRFMHVLRRLKYRDIGYYVPDNIDDVAENDDLLEPELVSYLQELCDYLRALLIIQLIYLILHLVVLFLEWSKIS